MSQKAIYYIAAIVGSIIGGLIPTLWGAGFLSLSSLFFSTVFAILAIVFVYKFFK
jgi:uncharacterized membrane protein YeaQ/YmgE (transglycosylase-associated protein family)